MRHTRAGLLRRGFAVMGALTALVLVAALLAMVALHTTANHNLARRRHEQLQAAWLARAGVELAIERLLSRPGGYTGETAEPIPQGRVWVTVEQEKGAPGTFRVTSEAHYPVDAGKVPAERTVMCRVRRVSEGERVRIEVVPGGK